MKQAHSKAKAKAKPKPKAKQKPVQASDGNAVKEGPRSRQPLVAEGLHTVVRKHSGMGCAIVSLSDVYVRQAVLAAEPLIYIEGITIQVKPHFEKDTNVEILKDLFLAWGHKVEKATPLPASLLVEFFDAKHAEIADGKSPTPQAPGRAPGFHLQPPSYEAPRTFAGYEAPWPSVDYTYKEWHSPGYSGHSSSILPFPSHGGAGYNPEWVFHQEQFLQNHAARELAGGNPAAAGRSSTAMRDVNHGGISPQAGFNSLRQHWPRESHPATSSTSRFFLHGEHADAECPLQCDQGEPEIYMSAAVRALVEREGGAFCIDSDDEQQLSSASATTVESVQELEEVRHVEPEPVTKTSTSPAADKAGGAVSQEAKLTHILSTFPPPPSSSLEAWLSP